MFLLKQARRFYETRSAAVGSFENECRNLRIKGKLLFSSFYEVERSSFRRNRSYALFEGRIDGWTIVIEFLSASSARRRSGRRGIFARLSGPFLCRGRHFFFSQRQKSFPCPPGPSIFSALHILSELDFEL